jgi:glycosyltransferase involved in cell wall biosynthesis
LRVLIINDYPGIIGGAERFLENLLHEAGTSAIEFHRIDIADLAKDLFPASGVSFMAMRLRRIRIFPSLVRMISKHIESESPDLIHLNNNNLFTNSVLKSLLHVQVPVVSFIHDEYALRRLASWFYLNITKSFTFLTHSRDLHATLSSRCAKTHLVKVPFNAGKWAHVHDETCQHYKVDLLYVGRIDKAKGVFKMIDAVERVKEKIPFIRLAVLGDGPALQALKQMVSKKNLEHNVEIRGLEQDHVIREYYHHARILLFPSAVESLGYVGLEAQSCGVPVVAFENKGSGRWCRDNYSGFLIKERSAQKLADKVLEIFHDDVILTRISTAARENIRLEGYNASKQEITDIYKAVLSW